MHIVKFIINRYMYGYIIYSMNVNFSGEIVNYNRKYILGKLQHWAHVEITLNQEKVGVDLLSRGQDKIILGTYIILLLLITIVHNRNRHSVRRNYYSVHHACPV